jgi:hypothetical protein
MTYSNILGLHGFTSAIDESKTELEGSLLHAPTLKLYHRQACLFKAKYL